MEIFLSVMSVIFAIIGVCIMVKQQRIAKQQVQLFILDKRYEFYDETLRLLFEMMAYGKVRNEEIGWRFLSQRRMAEHLFDAKMRCYADVIADKIGEMAVLTVTGNQSKVQEWFAGEYLKATDVFSPYLIIK